MSATQSEPNETLARSRRSLARAERVGAQWQVHGEQMQG
jgi:hypothetical protein